MPDILLVNNGHKADIHFSKLLSQKQKTRGFVFSFACRMRRKATHKSLTGYCLPV